MSKQKKVEIVDVIRELGAQMEYEQPLEAFEVLWAGWRQQCIRQGKHSYPFFNDMRKRGWMYLRDAREFCEYCHAGKRWRVLEEN